VLIGCGVARRAKTVKMGAGAQDKGGSSQPRANNIARSNFFSKLLFIFVDPLVSDGFKRTLQPEDLLELDSVRTKTVHKNFDEAWSQQLKKEKPDIKRAVISGCGADLIVSGILYALSNASSLAGPLLLNRIVGGLSCYSSGRANCEPQSQLY
jgi:hypothetical protein